MVEWITNNWVAVSAAIGLLLTALIAIAKLTPTDKDDTIIAKIKAFYDKFFPKK